METAMKPTRTILALLVAVLALPIAADGQDEEASTTIASNEETLDDIVVVGKKSASALRRDVFDAEDDFYALFNKLNDDNEYDVRCFYEIPTGSRLRNHVCRAKFLSGAYASQAGRGRNNLSGVTDLGANPGIARKTAVYQEKQRTSSVAGGSKLNNVLMFLHIVAPGDDSSWFRLIRNGHMPANGWL